MKIIIILLMLALALPPAVGQMAVDMTPHTVSVTLATDAGGNATKETRLIQGELLGMEYLNGNFTAGGNANIEDSHGVLLDEYNISLGSTYRAPGVKYANSSDAWRPYALSSKLWLNMTMQQHNKTAIVKIIYR